MTKVQTQYYCLVIPLVIVVVDIGVELVSVLQGKLLFLEKGHTPQDGNGHIVNVNTGGEVRTSTAVPHT